MTSWQTAFDGIKNIGNYFSADLARLLFDAVTQLPGDANILEIGAFYGFSTCAMGYACVDTQRHVWTIDTFIGNLTNTNVQDGTSYRKVFDANVRACGLTEYVTALTGRSEEFYGWDTPLDMLFIDGDHTIMEADFNAFFPSLKAGGALFMHDVMENDALWQSIRRQLDDAGWRLRLGYGRKRGSK